MRGKPGVVDIPAHSGSTRIRGKPEEGHGPSEVWVDPRMRGKLY